MDAMTPPASTPADPGGTDPHRTNPGASNPGGTEPGTEPGTDPGETNPGGTDRSAETKPRLPWPVRVFLCLPALLIALFLPFAIISITPLGQMLQAQDNRAAVANIVLCLLVTVVAVLIVMALMRWLDRRPLRESGWRWTRSSAGLLGIGLGISVLLVVVTTQALAVFGLLERVEVPWAQLGVAGVVATVANRLAQAFFLQGIPEELLFRGYLMQTIRERPKLALVVSTLFFGVIHVVSSGGQESLTERVIYLATPTGFGFLAAVLVLRLRSLWPAIGIHAGFHVGNLATSLTGVNTTSPVAWVTLGAIFAVAGFIALRGVDLSAPVRLER